MATYSIDIEYPIHIDGKGNEVLNEQSRFDVWEKFDSIKWRQCRTLQLQLSGKTTKFKITETEKKHTILFTLLDRTISGEVELSMQTNIAIVTSKKELFGLLNRKMKEHIIFERITLQDAKQYLEMILKNNLSELEHAYLSQAKPEVLTSALA